MTFRYFLFFNTDNFFFTKSKWRLQITCSSWNQTMFHFLKSLTQFVITFLLIDCIIPVIFINNWCCLLSAQSLLYNSTSQPVVRVCLVWWEVHVAQSCSFAFTSIPYRSTRPFVEINRKLKQVKLLLTFSMLVRYTAILSTSRRLGLSLAFFLLAM